MRTDSLTQVRYKNRVESVVGVPVDLALATNKAEVADYLARTAALESEAKAKGTKVSCHALIIFVSLNFRPYKKNRHDPSQTKSLDS